MCLLPCRYEKLDGKKFSILDAEYFLFHSPYNKVTLKLMFLDLSQLYLYCGSNNVAENVNVCVNLQLVQKSFARLLFNDSLRNARYMIHVYMKMVVTLVRKVRYSLSYICFSNYSSIDEAAKEKLAPFSSLTGDESYRSRDLEKVCNFSVYMSLLLPLVSLFKGVVLYWFTA